MAKNKSARSRKRGAEPVLTVAQPVTTATMGISPKEKGAQHTMVVVNLEGVKTSLELIPDGTYPARLTETKFGMSKSNQPKVSLTFVFDTEAGEEVGGRKAYVECSLQPQALFKVKKILIDLGMDPDDLETNVNLKTAFEDLAGASAVIRVGHHEYNGADHNDFYVVSPDSWTS